MSLFSSLYSNSSKAKFLQSHVDIGEIYLIDVLSRLDVRIYNGPVIIKSVNFSAISDEIAKR